MAAPKKYDEPEGSALFKPDFEWMGEAELVVDVASMETREFCGFVVNATDVGMNVAVVPVSETVSEEELVVATILIEPSTAGVL